MLNQVDSSPSSSFPVTIILLVRSPSPWAISFDISTKSFTGAVMDLLTKKPNNRLTSNPITVMIITTQMKVPVSLTTLAFISSISFLSKELMSFSIPDNLKFNSEKLIASNSLSVIRDPVFFTLSKDFMKLLSRFKNESMLFLDAVSLTIFDISSLSNL